MKRVLITGGSSGIGFEMSRLWASNGYNLLWVSHDEEELKSAANKIRDELKDVNIQFFVQDLIQDSGAQLVFDWAKSIGEIDVVINNAGFGTYGYVKDISLDREVEMIQLNAISLYKMTRLFMNEMIQKKDNGTIINICSNSAFQPVPRMTTYAATKGFVYQFSRGLQQELELQKSNLRIITVCPAAISDTPFKDHLPKSVKTFEGLAATTAKEVASDVWKGFQKGKSFVVTGRKMRNLYRIRGIMPESLTRFLVKKETEEM